MQLLCARSGSAFGVASEANPTLANLGDPIDELAAHRVRLDRLINRQPRNIYRANLFGRAKGGRKREPDEMQPPGGRTWPFSCSKLERQFNRLQADVRHSPGKADLDMARADGPY